MMDRLKRAQLIKKYGSAAVAVEAGALAQFQDVSVSEALIMGLINQGVSKFIGVFGHGTTDIAEVLRVYQNAGLVSMFNVRHETAASHAATALKIQTGETAAVITSIGPGALQAFAGSLAAASNGAGVYHIYGDETTHDEGFNMQQIPRNEQALFLKLCSVMGEAYSIIEPMSVFTALRRGAVQTGKAGFAGPFYLLAPMNVQPSIIRGCNLLEFPDSFSSPLPACFDLSLYGKAAEIINNSSRIVIKIGNGARGCGNEIRRLAVLIDAAIVAGPSATGIVPYSENRYMTVGGSKGSLAGNFAMNEADCVIIIGARAVCQWDSSGTAWKKARNIINFNNDPHHAWHYNRSLAITGDARQNTIKLMEYLKEKKVRPPAGISQWAGEIAAKRKEWEDFKKIRFSCPPLRDEVWMCEVLTQPVAIKIVCDFSDRIGAVKIFDAGDVQANGFQIVTDEKEGQTLTDTGSSYMGFAVSAVLAGAMSKKFPYPVAFTGDGSFTMNPQVLIDAVEHSCRGCIVIFDNRRMAAITGLQIAQYSAPFATSDSVEVDYRAMAASVKGINALYGGTDAEELKSCLEKAHAYDGLTVIHVPVYSGNDERGGMGVFGDWNVGNWCVAVQEEHHRIGL